MVVFNTLLGFEKLLLSLSTGNSFTWVKHTAGINNNINNFFIATNVSLTYLRGLEVAELKEEDMPMV
jgi:hypothetical protein